jgi:hypothetical protein
MFGHIDAINLNLFYVKGRGDIVLKLEVIKKIFAFAFLIASIPLGPLAICASKVLYEHVAMFWNTYPTGKLFNYGYFRQWKDFGGYFLLSLVSVLPAFLLTLTSIPDILVLIIGTILAIIIYVLVLHFVKDEIFEDYIVEECKSFIRRFVKR